MDVLESATSVYEAFICATMEAEPKIHLSSEVDRQGDPQTRNTWHAQQDSVLVPDGSHAAFDPHGVDHAYNER